MRVIDQYYEIVEIMPEDPVRHIALGARNCFKSEDKSSPESDEALVRKLKNMQHFSPFEHASATIRLVTDRGVMAELTRHRAGISFSIESTRYCSYNKDKFGNEITVIRPVQYEPELVETSQRDPFSDETVLDKSIQDFGADKVNRVDCWYASCQVAAESYMSMLEEGASPQEARSVLPHSTKTDILMTANFRELMHIFNLRTSRQAHPQIRDLIQKVQQDFQSRFPIIFGEKEN